MRRALHLDGLQALEAADAVIDMHDEIAGRERRKFGDEVGGLARLAAAADQAVAENVLLGDDGEVGGLETLPRGPARSVLDDVAGIAFADFGPALGRGAAAPAHGP